LFVLICASDKETIFGEIREKWLQETFKNYPKIKLIVFNYSEDDFPNTSVSSQEVSKIWTVPIRKFIPKLDYIFSSEQYGFYLAEYLNCEHIPYEFQRESHQISATQIRQNPIKYWQEIAPAAKLYFVKKVCVICTESTGKSTLTIRLSKHYNVNFVPEMAREIIEETEECTPRDLQEIAVLHAKTIQEKVLKTNGLLFVDTDINITRSYAKFLFQEELKVPDWIEEINRFDLYLFLENDVPFVQDGTRLDEDRRNILNQFHKATFASRNIPIKIITGNWEEKFFKAIELVDTLILS
jgi:HTH-type transcriptional regulator, transcriptional repressor of NAD biosynthesis genes